MPKQSIFDGVRFDNSYQQLPAEFYAATMPSRATSPSLLAFNQPLADYLQLNSAAFNSTATLAHLSGNAVPAQTTPIATAYAGHQFGHFNPRLGDGRALLLGELLATDGRRFDIQLKGAGVTPYSRSGDGRSALGPVLREYVVSEAMHALGIKTTRALAAVATGQAVCRQQTLPGAVLTRVASSHIRIGTFEFFARQGDMTKVKALADHVIARHYPSCRNAPKPYLALLQSVMRAQAELVVDWLSVGFIHGVMNTDNTSISGETIDYGPCAFMDSYRANTFYSAIDSHGRYAYDQQRGIIQWNLARLAECLLRLFDDDIDQAVKLAEQALADFIALFDALWLNKMAAKLGFSELTATVDAERAGKVKALMWELLVLMEKHHADFTLCFRSLGRALLAQTPQPFLTVFDGDKTAVMHWYDRWLVLLENHAEKTNADWPSIIKTLQTTNPAIIPRNYHIEKMIAQGLDGRFELIEKLMDAYKNPFDAAHENSDLAQPPEDGGAHYQTFCGT
ncbi:MAG: YdiU family protein [Marinagarivorans sp.]|nr:YdiU family protein [Marinagarivorans sp.]